MLRTEVHSRSRRAFTLVELLIGTSLSAIVMAGMLSAYLFLAQNLTRLNTTENFDRRSQRAVTLFSRDISTATKIVSVASTSSAASLVMNVPTGTVTYTWSGSAAAPGTLTRTETVTTTAATTSESLVSNVTLAVFTARDGNGNATATTFNTRQVQLTLTGALRASSGGTLATRTAASPNLLIASQALIQ
ncbi:MAG TPA: prepilin-type N-terminal cleavage/methylation domain-containing protein [Opitutaceae bacterium]